MTLGDNKYSKKKVALAASLLLAFVACGPVIGCGGEDPVVEPTPFDTGTETGDETGLPDTGVPDTAPPDDTNPPPDTGMEDTPTVPTATPSFAPPSGTSSAIPIDVTITSATAGAVIYYTTDGTNPNISSTKYAAPINVTTTTTIKAMALAPGLLQSEIATATYTIIPITGTVATPDFAPDTGTFANDVSVAMSSTTPAATICYTVDGSTPSCTAATATCSGTSATYSASAPVTVNTTGRVLKAIACKATMTNSAVKTATYTLQAAHAVFTPPEGTYASPSVSITASLATTGGVIRFTTDGTDPNCTTVGTVFGLLGGALTFTENTNLRAITCKAGYLDSGVKSYQYNVRAATPTTSVTAARENETTLSLAGGSGIICYTLNGVAPTCSSGASPACTAGTLWAASPAVKFDKATALAAVSCGPKNTQSEALSVAYTFKVATPTITPATGTTRAASGFPDVVVTTTTINTVGDIAADDVKIFYTLNGATPTCAAPSLTGTVTCAGSTCSITIPQASVVAGATVKAIACKTDYTNSDIASANYPAPGALAAPVASPGSGSYENDQSVTLTAVPADATICYTLGTTSPGTTADCNATTGACAAGSTTYTGAIAINQTGSILHAIACKAGSPKGSETSYNYTFNVAPVSLRRNSETTPFVGGAVNYGDVINFTSLTTGGSYRYTTDGSTPTCTVGTVGTSFLVNGTAALTLKVVGCKSGYNPSGVVTVTLNAPTLGPPVVAPAPGDAVPGAPTCPGGSTCGKITNQNNLTLTTVSSAAPGAKICYTRDGSAPTCDASLVCGGTSVGVTSGSSIALNALPATSTQIRALTCATGFANSTVTDRRYDLAVSRVVITPTPTAWASTGIYAIGDVVTLGGSMYRALKAMTGTGGSNATTNPTTDTTSGNWSAAIASQTVTFGFDASDAGGATVGAKLCYRTATGGITFTTVGTDQCTPNAGTTCVDAPSATTVAPNQSLTFSTTTTLRVQGCKNDYIRTTAMEQNATFDFTPYSHTINMATGSNDFTAVETFNTTAAGSSAYISWDATNLYVGFKGSEVISTSSNYLHYYVNGTNPASAGTTTQQEPFGAAGTGTLPGQFTHHFKIRVDSTGTTSPTLDWSLSKWNGTSWSVTNSSASAGAVAVSYARSGSDANSFFKVSVNRTALGIEPTTGVNPTNITGAVWNGTANVAGFPAAGAGTGTPFAKYLEANFVSTAAPNMQPLKP